MCGIVGFIKKGYRNDGNLIERMASCLSHRGPDGYGYYEDECVTLGHRRLSIIDISGGRQPMVENGYVIIFNGEIYNFRELRKILVSSGYKFRTDSDTEVLLKMYIEYKEKCLGFLNGMFAFAIWNKKNRELFLARDRLGIKPLYYSSINNNFIFASEIKSILLYHEFRKELNKKVLNSYFQYRYILGKETFFKNIFQLLPGHYLKWNLKIARELNSQQYWKLPVIVNKEDHGESFYIEETKKMVMESIRKRMISDVPIGAYLSGGLDSSIISAVMALFYKKKDMLNTFTIGFKEDGYNEFNYARLVADRYKLNHHEILLSAEDYIATMDKLIDFKDAPLAVPNEVPLYLMSKELKKYITVVLSGEGADELFGGYGRIFISYLEFKQDRSSKFLDFFLDRYNYVSDRDLSKFLCGELIDLIKKENYTYTIFSNYFIKISELDVKDKIPYIFQNLHLQGLLQRVDTTTMAASVEGRVPFVDHELVEFVNSIPFRYKIKWRNCDLETIAIKKQLSISEISENHDITKYLLRRTFANYLPSDIVSRKKMGFPVPLDDWFRGKFKDYAKSILGDKKTMRRGIFNRTYLKSEKYLSELSGINIWMMINLELFLRKYFD